MDLDTKTMRENLVANRQARVNEMQMHLSAAGEAEKEILKIDGEIRLLDHIESIQDGQPCRVN